MSLAFCRDSASSMQSFLQFDRLFGTGLHAQATPPTRIGIENKGLLSPVDEEFQPPRQRERSFLFRRNGLNDENVVRADRNARSFCFTAHKVDDRHHNTRIKPAIWVRLRAVLPFNICHDSPLLLIAQTLSPARVRRWQTLPCARLVGAQRLGLRVMCCR